MSNVFDTVTLPSDIRTADAGDAELLGAITADAFANDPVNQWIFGNEAGMRATFTMLARHVYGPRGYCNLAGEAAAAMWLPPGGNKDAGLWTMLGFAARVALASGSGAVSRALTVDKAMTAQKPEAPHVYLFTVGVRQDAQGKGLGKRLLAPVLTACDAKGLPAYLENSNPDNHGFYRSQGFEMTGLISPGKGAPELQAMWRDPQMQG
ncbi:MAG: GNAT family N-acetyltransferase [Sphingorhabdus sp.]